jgi:hypothetical protein
MEEERPRWRATGNYRVHPRLQIGLEWNIAVNEVGPLATLFLLQETHKVPALFLGTSSDRIGSPEGTQAYYATIAKHIPRTPVSPYASVNYSEWDEHMNFPFGANLDLTGGFSLMPMYDGERSHLLLSYAREHVSVSLITVWYEHIGIAMSGGF